MTTDTINDAVTMAGNAEGTLLADRYRVVRQLGQGGMGSVWLAEDTQLDNKPFAIKMLPSILVSNKRAYRQLKDEALVAMQLVHPNIVQIRAFEENNGNPFLVMDYIDGETLDDYLYEKCKVESVKCKVSGGLSEDVVIRLLKPIAAALDYAHTKGVVHRDVKPGNVMIAKDGTPFILDFGIAREIQETMTRVTGKLSSGTLLYMSPEQLRGLPPKPAQDVYSFAAMAYECLKGEPPFSRGQIEYQILNETPAPLPGESRVSASVMRGLAKSPEGRPDSCVKVLFAALPTRQPPPARVNPGKPPMRVAAPKVARPSESRESNAGRLIRPIVFILVALAMFAVAVWYRNAQRERQEEARKRDLSAQQAEAERKKAQEDRLARLRRESEERKANEAEAKRIESERQAREAEKQRQILEAARIKAAASGIRDVANGQKRVLDGISGGDGFEKEMSNAAYMYSQAEKLYLETKWRDAAVAFSNYVERCKAIVALDEERLAAIEKRVAARASRTNAEAAEARAYAPDSWDFAERFWDYAVDKFKHMDFADAKIFFENADEAYSKSCVAANEQKARQAQSASAKKEESRVAQVRNSAGGEDHAPKHGVAKKQEQGGKAGAEFVNFIPYVRGSSGKQYVNASVVCNGANIDNKGKDDQSRWVFSVSRVSSAATPLQGKSVRFEYGGRRAIKFISASDIGHYVEVELK